MSQLQDQRAGAIGVTDGERRQSRSTIFRPVGLVIGITSVVCIALRPILVKLAYHDVPDPVTILALQMGIALPFFVAAIAWDRGRENYRPPEPKYVMYSAALGLICYYIPMLFYFIALQYIEAGIAKIFSSLFPTIVTAILIIFFRKKPTARHLGALVISYSGAILIIYYGIIGNLSENYIHGTVLVLGAEVLLAVYLISGAHIIDRIGAFQFTCYALTAACVAALLQFIILRPGGMESVTPRVFLLATAMALPATAFPMLLFAEALRRIGANHAAIITAIGPVSTIVIGFLVLGETLTLMQIAGSVLVISGVVLTTSKEDH